MCHSFPPIASHFHYLKCIICLHFVCWFFFGVLSLKSILFLFSPSHCSPLPYSHPHIDKQPVKVKRKKSFNLSRKFPFYKSKENIVQDLVESEREYQLCDRGGVGGVLFLPSLSCFSSVFQLSSLRSPPGTVCVMAPLSSLSRCPRETPHTQSWHQAGDVGFSLVCLRICLWAPEECRAACAASCVRVCAQVLGYINTQAF